MSRIQLNDTVSSIAWKMSNGNPGALRVIVECIQNGATIDPDSALGGISPILSLDTLELYGPNIWMLYKDVCGENLYNMIVILRSWQLGFITSEAIHSEILGRRKSIDIQELIKKVQERLPKFQRI